METHGFWFGVFGMQPKICILNKFWDKAGGIVDHTLSSRKRY